MKTTTTTTSNVHGKIKQNTSTKRQVAISFSDKRKDIDKKRTSCSLLFL